MKRLSCISLSLLCAYIAAACGGGGTTSTSSTPVITVSGSTVPATPTIGAALVGDASVKVAFTAPSSDGGTAISSYTVTCTTSGTAKVATGTTSPVTVSGLINGALYSCTVTATNSVGISVASSSVTVTPIAGSTGGNSTVPGAPTISSGTAANSSAIVAFTSPLSNGGSAITRYTATCTANGLSTSGTGTASPITVGSLTNSSAYSCTVTATNSVGTGVASSAVTVTPTAGTTSTALNAVYKNVAWQLGVTVTFPTDCTMTYTSKGAPSHATSAYYLEPVKDVGGAVVATTAVSKMQLGIAAFGGAATTSTAGMTQTFNTCPTKAATVTATSGGAIGWMISGAAMFNATEGANNPTPALTDNVSYTFTDSSGVSQTAQFIDSCNGHPTPIMNTYHYHALPACVTALVDTTAGASHIIGIANDGFPIYGNKDINGAAIGIGQLDACNGITSATPEFPNGVYHYVLPDGVTSLRSSIGCYSGTVSKPLIAAAAIANGICYGPRRPDLLANVGAVNGAAAIVGRSSRRLGT